jgi:hypothetical protein
MAVGFPTKVTYADGDVFSASDINDTNGTINLLTSTTLSVAAGKNPVINGGMDVWQRGTSFTTTTTSYTADRWLGYRGVAGSTISRQATSDTTNLPFIQYAARVSRDSGNTSTSDIYFISNLESTNSIPFAGKAVTFSFYARKGANYSMASSALGVRLVTGTGTDQNVLIGGYTGSADAISSTATLTTTWQRFTFTGTIAATAKEFATLFTFTPVGTAGAADYFEVTGVQVEYGSAATSFSRAGSNYGGELALCQRYFYTVDGSQAIMGAAYNATSCIWTTGLPVTMRTAPTGTYPAVLTNIINDLGNGVNRTPTAIATYSAKLNNASFYATGAPGGSFAIGYPVMYNSTSLTWSAEL